MTGLDEPGVLTKRGFVQIREWRHIDRQKTAFERLASVFMRIMDQLGDQANGVSPAKPWPIAKGVVVLFSATSAVYDSDYQLVTLEVALVYVGSIINDLLRTSSDGCTIDASFFRAGDHASMTLAGIALS